MLFNLRALFPASATLAVATTLFAAAPFHIQFDPELGQVKIAASMALAKGGDDDSGGDDNGGDDDSDDDSSGGGSDDDDDSDDDSSGGGSDDDGDDDSSGGGSGGGGGRDDDDDGGIEVTLSDGSRIEIEDGRYERKDASGRTIEERPARRSDYARLQQAGTASGGGSRVGPDGSIRGGGTVAKVEVAGNNIEVTYTDGWKEEIENGRYQLKDAQNRTVIERPARPSDVARLSQAVR